MWATLAIAHHHYLLGRPDQARADAVGAVALSTETGFPWSIGASHRMLASVLVITDDWAAAAPHFRTSLGERAPRLRAWWTRGCTSPW